MRKKTEEYSVVYRDDYNTGGNISFDYDEESHTAYFGGKDEVLQYYKKDIAKGWYEDGFRVGVKLYAPKKLDNYQSATAKIGNETYEGGSFYKQVNGENSLVAEFYPIVSEKNKTIELKIVWQEGIKEQIYKIIVRDGTIFYIT